MKKYLFYIALTGWTFGLFIHILSLADIDVREKVPFVWILHIGIFMVWLPVVLDLKNNEELKKYQQSGITDRLSLIKLFKIVFKDTPTWMSVIAIGGLFYAFINFLLFMSFEGGTPDINNGLYVLQNHGQIIKTLTEQEYHHYKANEIRAFSGHWIFFYGVAAAFLYKFSGLINKTETN